MNEKKHTRFDRCLCFDRQIIILKHDEPIYNMKGDADILFHTTCLSGYRTLTKKPTRFRITALMSPATAQSASATTAARRVGLLFGLLLFTQLLDGANRTEHHFGRYLRRRDRTQAVVAVDSSVIVIVDAAAGVAAAGTAVVARRRRRRCRIRILIRCIVVIHVAATVAALVWHFCSGAVRSVCRRVLIDCAGGLANVC